MNKSINPRQSAFIVLFFGILCVSTAAIFIRFAQDEVSSLVIAAYRLSIATLFLLPIVLLKTRSEIRNLTKKDWLQLSLAGIFLGLHFAAWITSLEMTSVASSVVLVTTTPLWVAIFSPLVLKERLNPGLWTGLLLSMVGGILVGLSESCTLSGLSLNCGGIKDIFQGKALVGNLLALAGAWFSASYLMTGRKVRPHLSLYSYTFIVYGVAAVLLILMAGFRHLPFTGFSSRNFLFLILLGIIPQLFGHSSFNWALRYLPATFVSLALLGEPIGATILAVIFLSESPSLGELLGGVLILTGIYLASRMDHVDVKNRKEIAKD